MKIKIHPTLLVIFGFLFFAICYGATCQEPPPHPINVTWTNQNLSFGSFYQGAVGGSVTVSEMGVRSATGDVVLLTLGVFTPSRYKVQGHKGTVVSILNGPDVFLPGSNGGSIRLHIGNSNPASPFVLPPGQLFVDVGGTITIGNPAANPPGDYSGSFDLTFVQE